MSSDPGEPNIQKVDLSAYFLSEKAAADASGRAPGGGYLHEHWVNAAPEVPSTGPGTGAGQTYDFRLPSLNTFNLNIGGKDRQMWAEIPPACQVTPGQIGDEIRAQTWFYRDRTGQIWNWVHGSGPAKFNGQVPAGATVLSPDEPASYQHVSGGGPFGPGPFVPGYTDNPATNPNVKWIAALDANGDPIYGEPPASATTATVSIKSLALLIAAMAS